MKFAALVQLNQLRQRRDVAVHVVEYRADGGAVVQVLDVSRPVTPRTVPGRLRILPSGEIAGGSPDCVALAAA